MATPFIVTSLLLLISAASQHSIQDSQCTGVVRGTAVDKSGQLGKGLTLTLEPLGVDLGYILPTTKTNQAGEYRFGSVCPGRFTVLVEDEDAGYPDQYHFSLLYLNRRIPQVNLTALHAEGALRVEIPPKPGFLVIHATDGKTGANISSPSVILRLAGKSRRHSIKIKPGDNNIFAIPSDTDVLLHLNVPGFREWNESKGRGKLIHVPPGTQINLNAQLTPTTR